MNIQLRLIVISACFFMASCGASSDSSHPSVTATHETSTPSPQASETPTPTKTLEPTTTFTPSPTATPGPMWHTQFGEFPHVVNENGRETFNYELDFKDWLRLPNINPETIQEYYATLKQVRLSDGSLLVKPMTGPAFDSLPSVEWTTSNNGHKDVFHPINQNIGDPKDPPIRFVGGFVFFFPGSKQNFFADDFVGVTMQVLDRTKPEGYSLWTAIFPKGQLSQMHSGRVKGMIDDSLQLTPFLNFSAGDTDTGWWDMEEFLRTQGWFDPAQNDQALKDFGASKPNNWLDSHVLLAQTGGTRWIPPTK